MKRMNIKAVTAVLLTAILLIPAQDLPKSRAVATITVTNTNDSGEGSLRQAIADAASGDTINFSVTGTITLTSGQLVIDKNLTIQGPGARLLSISGNDASIVFFINGAIMAALDGMTITGGNADGGGGGGGGIFNDGGTLTVSNCTVSGNHADDTYGYGSSYGGGILNSGTLTVSNSTISGNHAYGGGGLSNLGILTVNNSTISDNTVDDRGGGIGNGYGRTLTVTNSTISDNAGPGGGPGIYCYYPSSVNITLRNSIIAGNNGGDIGGDTVASASHNLIGDSASSGGIQHGVNGNIVGKNPMLGPLRNYGGLTMTYALLAGSPAINAGNNALAIGQTDQRGAGFARIVGGTVDMGSFELQIRPSPLR